MTDRHTRAAFAIPSDLAEARRLQDEIEDALQANRYGERDIFSIRLALEEVLVNAMKHGNQLDPAKFVRGEYSVTDEQFDIRIEDEGPGFDPNDVPDPTEVDGIERACGRGVFLIKHYMSRVEYHGRGNVVTMTRLRSPADPE